jgi:hypothetical protein
LQLQPNINCRRNASRADITPFLDPLLPSGIDSYGAIR